MTNLPSSDQAFKQSREENTLSLAEAMACAEGTFSLAGFAVFIIMANVFGRNLEHLHRSSANDRPEDPVNGEFWKRHRELDTVLFTISMFLPENLRLPVGLRDPHIVLLNAVIHTATICLHQAAIEKAEQHNLSPDIIRQSNERCFAAAAETVSIMRLTCHMDAGDVRRSPSSPSRQFYRLFFFFFFWCPDTPVLGL
jgi:hypothetical protein